MFSQLRIETSEDPNDKDFTKLFIRTNTLADYLQLRVFQKVMEKYGITLIEGDEKDKCTRIFYLEGTKRQLKNFMKKGCDKLCRNCDKVGKKRRYESL